MSTRSTQPFPHWTGATPSDIDILTRQLGRRPSGVLHVAKRCRFGRPQAIVNAPVRLDRAGRARPFPTLFWLTCPYLVKEVGGIEAGGWIDRMRLALEQSGELARAMVLAHRAHARLRMALCDLEAARSLSPAELEVLKTSGVGGLRHPIGVKCLHAHLADYLGRQGGDGVNVVGRETAGLLLERGVDLDGRPTCAACLGCSVEDGAPLAAIDVGSNAVRMLVARVERDEQGHPESLLALDWGREVTRLGEALGPGGQGSAEREAASGGLTGARMEAQTGQHAQGAQGDQGLWDAQDVREVRAIEIAGRSPSSPSQQATLAAIERFAQKARVHGARTILGVATAAVREGAGGRALLLEVWERCGFSLRAIPGNEEAELAFVGALRALGEDGGGHIDESEPVAVVDVGGGSTEVVGGDASGAVRWSVSVPVGAVRLTREFSPGAGNGSGQPLPEGERPTGAASREARSTCGRPCDAGSHGGAGAGTHAVGEAMYQAARARLAKAGVLPPGEKPGRLVATGGAAASLAAMALRLSAYDPNAVRGARLQREDVKKLLGRVSSMPLAERLEMPGLDPDRADIIPAGLAILSALMDLMEIEEVTVSDGGVMHGLIWLTLRDRAHARG